MFKNLANLFFGEKSHSNSTAKNRLQMVLVQDRSGLTAQDMDVFKKDLLSVIGKYFVLEKNSLEVEWDRDSGYTSLVINTPVVGRPAETKKTAKAATG